MRLCLLAALLGSGLLAATPAAPRGNLFSAVLCADTPLGAHWARLLPEAQKRFPGLKLTRVEDLHITVVYLGPDWQPAALDRIRPLALIGPASPQVFTPTAVTLGARNQVVAVELHPPSPDWDDAVAAAKAELNRLGLKRHDPYDATFRPHVTLAQAGHNPPDAADTASLVACLAWLQEEIARDPQPFTLTLGPATPVRLLLAGTARPPGAPEYVTVEDFLNPPPPHVLPAGR